MLSKSTPTLNCVLVHPRRRQNVSVHVALLRTAPPTFPIPSPFIIAHIWKCNQIHSSYNCLDHHSLHFWFSHECLFTVFYTYILYLLCCLYDYFTSLYRNCEKALPCKYFYSTAIKVFAIFLIFLLLVHICHT